MASKLLGAGRKTKDDPIDLSIGIVLKKKVGDRVEKGEPLAVFYSDGDETKIEPAVEKFLDAYAIGERQVASPQLFYARVFGDRVEKFSA
jgi:pyrimidine-nucleoside phosphorylase